MSYSLQGCFSSCFKGDLAITWANQHFYTSFLTLFVLRRITANGIVYIFCSLFKNINKLPSRMSRQRTRQYSDIKHLLEYNAGHYAGVVEKKARARPYFCIISVKGINGPASPEKKRVEILKVAYLLPLQEHKRPQLTAIFICLHIPIRLASRCTKIDCKVKAAFTDATFAFPYFPTECHVYLLIRCKR